MNKIRYLLLGVLLFTALLCLAVFSVPSVSPLPVATLVYVQGDVTVCRVGTEHWEEAKLEQKLYGGDSVKTGPASRAKILWKDKTKIQLDENTQVIFRDISTSLTPWDKKKPVPKGEIWLRNNNEKFRFELKTPTLTPRP